MPKIEPGWSGIRPTFTLLLCLSPSCLFKMMLRTRCGLWGQNKAPMLRMLVPTLPPGPLANVPGGVPGSGKQASIDSGWSKE